MKLSDLVTRQDAINMIMEHGFELVEETFEGAILKNPNINEAVEFFCTDAICLSDLIHWFCAQTKMEVLKKNFNDLSAIIETQQGK